MTARKRLTATFVTRILTHYRVPFHDNVRELLSREGVDYRLLYGPPDRSEAAKGDLAQIDWAEQVSQTPLLGREKLVWQHVARSIWRDDLVILGQENQLLVNYPLQTLRSFGGPKLALFGHGRNFQARDPNSLAERWKRIWATKVDWWFAYTDETRRHVESLGFPPERITVFNNAIDSSQVRDDYAAVTPKQLAKRREELALRGDNIGIFVGGIYADKRIPFLIEAARAVRAQVPDFELIVTGGGPDAPLLAELARHLSWIKVVGPRFGADKVELMALAKLFLMPGLVGLAVVDAGAAKLPTVTTAFPWHSPEIAYVEDGKSGAIVPDWEDAQAYADAVVALLSNPGRLAAMRAEASLVAESLTIEAMAERFAEGVLKALNA